MSRHRSKSDPVAQRVRRQRSESLDVDKDRASNTPRFYQRAGVVMFSLALVLGSVYLYLAAGSAEVLDARQTQRVAGQQGRPPPRCRGWPAVRHAGRHRVDAGRTLHPRGRDQVPRCAA